MDFHNL